MTHTETLTHYKPIFSKQNFWSGIFFGIGVIAAVDEIIFHQILQWHHFYDHSTSFIGTMTDGFLTAGALFFIVLGFFMFADLKRRHQINMRLWTASFLIGIGFFQLFDGIVDHKILRIHQIRYVDNLWMYDLIWNSIGIVFLLSGIIFLIKIIKKGKSDA